jgi:conjugal transfer mating pair stabilization protein TraG
MWKSALDAVVGILGTNSWHTLLRIAGTFSVLAVLMSFIKGRNPLVFVQWLAVFMFVTSILIVPKRSVQVIDISDPAVVWVTDNVPVGLAAIASITTGIGYQLAQIYDTMMARPNSLTYTKTGMLFGSQIVAETNDFRTQNPVLAQMLPDYVENCVVGDILLNHKYTVNQLLNTSDPLTLITSNPSPLRGIYDKSTSTPTFITCQQAASTIQTLANTDAQTSSVTFGWLTKKVFGNKVNGSTLLANAMGESYGYFYAGGLTAAQIMKNNITNGAIQQGIKGFAARSADTANLMNLANESAETKQRLSWSASNALATRTLPFAQSLLMLILVCLFPLVIALAAANHSLFGLNTLKIYISGFLYFQMWPVMFAILNFATNFWGQTQTGGTPLVLANSDQVALQHSDMANLAGYLALSIPLLSFYLTKGAATIGSQVTGSVFGSMSLGASGAASTTADGNWSFNNMSMDNVSQNKLDTNLSQRQGQQTWQADNGSTRTMTSSGQNVLDSSGAMSNLPVNMRLSQLASSGFQEQARHARVQAESSLDGYNHSVTSGWSQLSQLSRQTGSSDSLSQGSDSSQATNSTRGASMMMSAAESYAKANHISTQEAYNQLMTKSQEGSVNAGASVKISSGDQALGKIGQLATGASGEVHGGAELKGTTGSSHGTQQTDSDSLDNRHDKNSQAVQDFRQGMDMVTSSRVTDSGNHTENAATSDVNQLAATLNDAKSQYHQYTTSTTQSVESSRMASLAQNESASLDTNYNQEFVNWASDKYGDKAPAMLTSAPSARDAAVEFVNERLKPEIMGDYQQGRADLDSGAPHEPFTPSPSGYGSSAMPAGTHSDPVQNGNGSARESVSATVNPSPAMPSGGGTHSDPVQSGNGPAREYGSATANQSPAMPSGGGTYSDPVQSGNGPARESGSVTANQSSAEPSRGDTATGRGDIHSVSAGRTETPISGKQGPGHDMVDDFKDNKSNLKHQSEQTFPEGNEISNKVAEQRSKNEENINNSTAEINKNRSTVQASSDILKGEYDGAQNRFATGSATEQAKQKLFTPDAESQEIKHKLDELRRRAG